MEAKIIVCLASYFKGYEFMDEMHRLGNRVILLTSDNLKDKNWPHHALEDIFFMAEERPSVWNLSDMVKGFSYLMQNRKVDAVVALDDYDVEKAALLRETFRIPGMGQTTHRYFRDKLAMRQMAKLNHIDVPEFSAIFNNEEVKDFVEKVPAPWVLKPRSEASATGIKKISNKDHLWEIINSLGDERHKYLLESFKPGDVYHVDSLTYKNKVVFTSASKYLAPPMQISHEGGIFRSITLGTDSEEFKALKDTNAKVLKDFGLANGATHTEFIRGKDDGKLYFLETSSRVGGAHIPEMVEAATGINLWKEWAKIEDSLLKNADYEIAEPTELYSGLIIALTKNQFPDYTEFECNEVVRFLPIDYHVGIVYKSESENTVREKLDEAAEKINDHLLNILPPKDQLGS